METYVKKPYEDSFWKCVDFENRTDEECWPWIGPRFRADGPGVFYYGCRSIFAHRLAYCLLYECELPRSDTLMHTCKNPICCNPLHFAVRKRRDKFAERHAKECETHHVRGDTHPRAKLTASLVLRMRAMYEERGMSINAIAQELDIKYNCVYQAIRGLTWTHLKQYEQH